MGVASADDKRRPNVLFISVDDLNWIGITEPWTPAHIARMEQVLDLDPAMAAVAHQESVSHGDA